MTNDTKATILVNVVIVGALVAFYLFAEWVFR